MSGEYALLLKRRSEAMLRLARRLLEEGEYDLAALNAEYAAQLRVKSLLYRVTGEEWRGHQIRGLLGVLASSLASEGFRELADEVVEFVRRNRGLLAELEEAHTRAVYGVFSYSREQAEALVKAAEMVIRLVSKIESRVFSDER